MLDYKKMSAIEIREAIAAKKATAVEIAQESIRLAKTEGKELNAFITVRADEAHKDLVAGRGFVADEQLSPLAAGLDAERKLRVFKAEFRVGVFMRAHLGGGEPRGGREFFQRAGVFR